MVEVLDHGVAPLLAGKLAEERMPPAFHCFFSCFGEAAEHGNQSLLFGVEVFFIYNDEVGIGGQALFERLFVGDYLLNERPNEPAHKCSLSFFFAKGNLHRQAGVRHHLGYVHFAPLPLAIGRKSVDAVGEFARGAGFEDVLHMADLASNIANGMVNNPACARFVKNVKRGSHRY